VTTEMDRVLAELERAGNAPEIIRDPEAVAHKSHDWWVRGRISRKAEDTQQAAAIVRPRATAEVSTTLAWADRTRTPVVPFGLGSGVCGGVQAGSSQVVLDMSGMVEILDVDDASLTVTVQPGIRGSDFEDALQHRGLTMGHFPQSVALSTVGGWCATRAAGQLSTLYGNIEDMVLGCEVVVPGGEIWRMPATVRSSTGPDLKHLFLGSEGTLGVFTELTLRLHPLPSSRAGGSFRLPDLAAGIEILRQAMRSGWRPAVTRLYDATEAGRNFRVASHSAPVLLLLSEGPDELVTAEQGVLERIALACGAESLGADPVESWLRHRNEVPDIGALIEQGLVVDTIEVAASWNHLGELFDRVVTDGSAMPGMIAMSGHVSHCYTQGANIYFTFVASESDAQRAVQLYDRVWSMTLRHTRDVGGTIAHHHGIGRVRKKWLGEELGSSLALLRRVKRMVDPHDIMNPGVLLD
jgi:alkyldihydroxyacetonephosphate synthase